MPVLWATAFMVVFGITKAIFALQMVMVTAVQGAAAGPWPLLALNAIDLAVGIAAAGTAFFFVVGRAWAGRVMRFGWLPFVFYEIGRGLGLAAAGIGAAESGFDLAVKVMVLALLVSAGLCGVSSASNRYLASRS